LEQGTQPEAKVLRDTSSSLLEIRAVGKQFAGKTVLTDLTLDVAPGEFLTILGESGSGKTTLLRLIAGFEQPDAGEIWMEGERLDALPPFRRRVNTVFQHYALFPHLSVEENVAYGLRVRGVPPAEAGERVLQALQMVKMEPWARSAPAKLSGGQQQRVALARALINRPRLLLLDEPLSALDAGLRRQMQGELKALQREVGVTFVFVTHDQDEAMALSDRIALLRAGALEQVAPPREVYLRPATAYAASFVGRTNLLRAAVAGGIARAGSLSFPCSAAEGEVSFSLRPEQIRRCNEGPTFPDSVRFRAAVIQQSFAGATDLIEAQLPDGQRLQIRLAAQEPLPRECEFEFSAADAVRVKESAKR
jgi:putative spermidine/putrescine transport system ATP-binding protein